MVPISFGNLFNYWFGFFLFCSLGENTICSSVNFGWNVWCLSPTLGARKNPNSSHWNEKKKDHLHSSSIDLWVLLWQLIFFNYNFTIYCVILKDFARNGVDCRHFMPPLYGMHLLQKRVKPPTTWKLFLTTW